MSTQICGVDFAVPLLQRASSRLPSGPGSTKSTSIVVPPDAAANVPLSKVSAAVVPMNGISRCVCGSIPPGIT